MMGKFSKEKSEADYLLVLRVDIFGPAGRSLFSVFGTKSVDLPMQSLGSLLNHVWPDDQTIRQLLSRLSNLWDLSAAYQICGVWTFSPSDGNGNASGEKTL